MNEITVHPTMKFVNAGYVAILVAIAAGTWAWFQYGPQDPAWVPLLFLALLLWPASRHLRRLSVRLTVSTDKLRYQTGLLGRSTRTIQLVKVQDVRVDQSLLQRIFGVGSLSIETAGEASRLTVHDIENPQSLADEIMRRSELASGTHGIS
jgi:hypothetical protein